MSRSQRLGLLILVPSLIYFGRLHLTLCLLWFPVAVLVQLPPPALQIAGVHLQSSGHFPHALAAVQAAHRGLLELFGEFPSRLHLPVFSL